MRQYLGGFRYAKSSRHPIGMLPAPRGFRAIWRSVSQSKFQILRPGDVGLFLILATSDDERRRALGGIDQDDMKRERASL